MGILLFVSEEPQLLNPFQLVITDPDIEGANIANLVELDDDENVQVANYELHLRIALFINCPFLVKTDRQLIDVSVVLFHFRQKPNYHSLFISSTV